APPPARRPARARGTRATRPSGRDALDLEQARDRLGGLRALAEPVLHLRLVELDRRGLGLRVVTTDDLEEPAVARRARVGGDDAVDRVLLGAHPREPELDCHRRYRVAEPASASWSSASPSSSSSRGG